MEGGGAVMAEDSTRAARQYSGQPASPDRDARIADRVHTPMDGMEQTSCEPAFDMTLRDAHIDQLPPGDHTMLSTGQL